MEIPIHNIGSYFVHYTKYEYLKPSPQQQGAFSPPLQQKPYTGDKPTFRLPSIEEIRNVHDKSMIQGIFDRESIRNFSDAPLDLDELAFILWATQGVKEKGTHYTIRTVPSAGARHAFETYLAVFNVKELKPALYRYLPLEHDLLLENDDPSLSKRIINAALGQSFCGNCAVTFIWTAVVSRMTWRYGERGYRYLYLDAGHLCQNLYLTCQLIGAGCCAIGAFDDDMMNKIVDVDGNGEFVIYMAPVGKIQKYPK